MCDFPAVLWLWGSVGCRAPLLVILSSSGGFLCLLSAIDRCHAVALRQYRHISLHAWLRGTSYPFSSQATLLPPWLNTSHSLWLSAVRWSWRLLFKFCDVDFLSVRPVVNPRLRYLSAALGEPCDVAVKSFLTSVDEFLMVFHHLSFCIFFLSLGLLCRSVLYFVRLTVTHSEAAFDAICEYDSFCGWVV